MLGDGRASALLPGAPLEVCVPSGREPDLSVLAKGMFDDAMGYAFGTLQLDIFPRFEESEEATELRAGIEAEHARSTEEGSGWEGRQSN